MKEDTNQQEASPELQNFHKFVCENIIYEIDITNKSTQHHPFLPADKRQEFFTADSNLEKILSICMPNYDSRCLKEVSSQYLGVLCTLLSIGKGELIRHFKQYKELNDNKLPFTPTNPPGKWPHDSRDSDFFSKFCVAQHKFCVPALRAALDEKSLPAERVLPITSMEWIGEGNSADIYRIKVHSFYNDLRPDSKTEKVSALFSPAL
jgi:hypothetical protein